MVLAIIYPDPEKGGRERITCLASAQRAMIGLRGT
jgi:hypothetical protein